MDKSEFVDLDSIDLRVYLKILHKWKWLIVGITLLAMLTSGVLSFLVLSPVYQSKTVIMVKQYQDPKTADNKQQQDDLQSVVNSISRLPQMTIKTYVDQIQNEALLRNIIEILKLDKTIYTPESLANLIDVKAVPDTNLIELVVKNNDPNLAAQLANTLADKFLEFVGSANQKQLSLSADFLTKQLTDKNNELTQAANKLNKYRNEDRNVAYLEQEVQNKHQNLASNQSQLLKAESDYQQTLVGKTVAEEKLSNVPVKISIKKIDVETGKPVETEEINPAYAELTQLLAQKSVVLAELDASKKSTLEAVNQLQSELKNLQSELNGKRETETQLQEKVEQIKKTRDVLDEKLTQVEIIRSVNLSQTSLQIVTPAFPQDKPVSPKKMLNMAIALLLGMMVSVVLTFILEFMNDTINKAEDVDQHLGLPILGTIPFARKEDFE